MALEIEDGTGKADATSYVTVAEARAYALARGVTLGADPVVESQLVAAMDYLESLRARYQGHKTWPRATTEHPAAQALQWPRRCVVIDCTEFPEDAIPVELKRAQMQAVIELFNGFTLMASSDGRLVKREKVDVIETEYMTGQDMGAMGTSGATFPALDALLEPLFESCGGGFALRTVRV